jgi:CheY-like chemotaxis protein
MARAAEKRHRLAVARWNSGLFRLRAGTRPARDLIARKGMITPVRHVLIVDDDAGTRVMLSTLLSEQGFHTIAAEDGLEALHLLRAIRHRAPLVPCLVLLDLMMPRLSGHGFRRAQLGDPSVAPVPVAVMSGMVDIEERGRSLGAVATLVKPLDLGNVLEIVNRYCA